jgi:pyruvate dehydrogenase E1 component beta subunit
MDIKTVLGSAEKTGRVVVVHEAPRNAGLGAEIAALIQERAMLSLLAPIQRVCGFDSVFPFPRLEEHYLPTKERVMEAVQKTLDF